MADTWKMVPVDPTPEMLAALVPDSMVEIVRFRGYLFPHAVVGTMRAEVAKSYRKMIDAAPNPQPPATNESPARGGRQG